jgi:gluconolactonase
MKLAKVYGRRISILAATLAAVAWAGVAVAQTDSRPVAVEADITFTEGPTVDEAGAVYFTDLRGAGRILKMDTDGTVSTYREPSNRANGLIFDSEWRLLACEGGRGEDVLPRITRTNVETGEIEVLADHFEGKQLHQPNDLTIDGQGRVYFTDRPGPVVTAEQTGVHGVYRIDPDGSIARILTEPDIERPNGIVISPDDTTLYLIETAQQEGGARMIRAYDLAEDGTASNMRVFHDFYPGRSGDGMTIDSEGNLYTTGPGGIQVFAPDATCLGVIHVPQGVANFTWGDADLRSLFINAGSALYRTRINVPGRTLF